MGASDVYAALALFCPQRVTHILLVRLLTRIFLLISVPISMLVVLFKLKMKKKANKEATALLATALTSRDECDV